MYCSFFLHHFSVGTEAGSGAGALICRTENMKNGRLRQPWCILILPKIRIPTHYKTTRTQKHNTNLT